MDSFLDSETPRERERGGERRRGAEGQRIQNGLPRKRFKVRQKLRDGQGFRIRPLFRAGAKGAESGVKGRQIRRPFYSD